MLRFLPALLAFAFLIPSGRCEGPEKNRFNLSDKPEKPRFPITDISWPKNVGEAEICLWHDDKVAALSLGVDDNQPGDIEWWKEQAALYDFKVTWFIITGRLDYSRSTGYWKQYQELSELGHGIESHTVTHLHLEDPGWGTPEWVYTREAGTPPNEAEIPRGIEWEYAESKAQIEKHIPGKEAGAMAYPGGKNAVYHDRNLAAKHYRVVRGARGAQNSANAIDYMATNAQSSWHFGDESKHGAGNVQNILDPQLYRGLYYRGWAILFAHQIHETINLPLLKQTFEWMKENRDKLWVGLFADVGKYGQERDTAKLTVESVAPEKITFSLTDEMDDRYFNFPLTIKVRVPDAWKTVAAVQGDKPIPAKVVEHAGAAYALVQAVPDAGLVALTAK